MMGKPLQDKVAVAAAHASLVASLGRVDVLANNAGILSNNKMGTTSAQAWRRVMSANLDGAMFWAQCVAPGLGPDHQRQLPGIALARLHHWRGHRLQRWPLDGLKP